MISPEGLSVPALLDAAALDNREAAVFPDGRASLTELAELSTSYARALVSLGAGPGDHVGALLPAGLPVVALILGAARIGAVAVPWAAAFVKLRPGASLTAEEITCHCLEQLATFKVPRYVRFVTEWPMSGTKIQKGRLRQRIADELAAGSVTEAPRMSRPAAQAEGA